MTEHGGFIFISEQTVHGKKSYRKYLVVKIKYNYYLYELDYKTEKIKTPKLMEFEDYSLYDLKKELYKYYYIKEIKYIWIQDEKDPLGEWALWKDCTID